MSRPASLALAAALMTLPVLGPAQTLPLVPQSPTTQTLPGLTLVQDGKEAERAALAEFLPPAMEG